MITSHHNCPRNWSLALPYNKSSISPTIYIYLCSSASRRRSRLARQLGWACFTSQSMAFTRLDCFLFILGTAANTNAHRFCIIISSATITTNNITSPPTRDDEALRHDALHRKGASRQFQRLTPQYARLEQHIRTATTHESTDGKTANTLSHHTCHSRTSICISIFNLIYCLF